MTPELDEHGQLESAEGMPGTCATATVALTRDAVEDALEQLEEAMDAAETTLTHDEVRPSAHLSAHRLADAYAALVEAHPEYELERGGGE